MIISSLYLNWNNSFGLKQVIKLQQKQVIKLEKKRVKIMKDMKVKWRDSSLSCLLCLEHDGNLKRNFDVHSNRLKNKCIYLWPKLQTAYTLKTYLQDLVLYNNWKRSSSRCVCSINRKVYLEMSNSLIVSTALITNRIYLIIYLTLFMMSYCDWASYPSVFFCISCCLYVLTYLSLQFYIIQKVLPFLQNLETCRVNCVF